MAIFGPLVDALGAVLLNVAGVVYTLAGLYAWLALRPALTPAPVPIPLTAEE